ncbi:putative surface protease GP63 [Trypanosoma theileri]|uniref:Leishmanolysin-like peptidase n=1 Tax=Trypanosoma theileri TaxID=67003 RepID=A0A1X0NDG7_9TRYP|nr:putative surface protease GP63 [Trypanosoma theileri]ORC80783.1 putative surface protease GP63 [Trypanosoma theileri]
MRHPLLQVVLLLFICGAMAGPAYACNYDEIKKKNSPPVVVVRELPKKGEGAWQAYTVATSEDSNSNEGWEALRIRVSTEDLNKKKYCVNYGERRKDFLDGEEVNCNFHDIMLRGKEEAIKNEILPKAIKLHTDRLLVQRLKTPLQVPKFSKPSVCSHFTSPGDHASHGVQDADFLLYVAAGPSKNTNHSSWAVTCAVDQTKRPIVGAMNIHPLHADSTRVNVRLAAHKLAHALGFDYERMKGRGMTRHSSNYHDNRAVIDSAKVLEVAKEHYKCNSLKEVELEHTAEGNTTSHWNRRNMKDELMSMVSAAGNIESVGYYTALTIAAFHDMQYYRGNFSMAEPMSWGYMGGCNFGNVTIENTKRVLAPNGYCIEALEKSCSSDRLGVINSVAPTTKEVESICPILVADVSFFCTSEGDVRDRDVGLFRNDSWCLDVDYPNLTIDEEKKMKRGMCAAVNCSDNGVFRVQLTVDGPWHNCWGNEFIMPNKTDYPMYAGGRIKCPIYDEVCTVKSDGSSRLTSQANENTPLEIKAIWVSSTPTNPTIEDPPHSSVQRSQGPQTSTVNNAQQTTSTTTTADANRQRSSTTPTATVNKNGKTTRSSTESTTTQGSVKQEDTNKNSKKASNRRKDNSKATKVYSPLVLLVLLVSALLISF